MFYPWYHDFTEGHASLTQNTYLKQNLYTLEYAIPPLQTNYEKEMTIRSWVYLLTNPKPIFRGCFQFPRKGKNLSYREMVKNAVHITHWKSRSNGFCTNKPSQNGIYRSYEVSLPVLQILTANHHL